LGLSAEHGRCERISRRRQIKVPSALEADVEVAGKFVVILPRGT
jgi:hypothetical protein